MEDIIKKLKYFDKKFPRGELEEALKRRNEIIPILLDTLDEIIENPEIITENEDYMLHLYGLYLLAQFRERRAFPRIIDLISFPPEEVEFFLGDTITEGLSSIMYSTYDGQLPLLQSVIENPLIDLYVRGSALQVFGKLYSEGEFTREYFIDYLRELIDAVPYHDYDTDLATDIQGVVIDHHIFEMVDDIQYLYDEGRIDRSVFGRYDSFIDWIYTYEREHHPVKYIDDVISEMQWWACFEKSDQEKRNQKKPIDDMEKELFNSISQNRQQVQQEKKIKVGRNDPCPCGSGKKYKRCYIDKIPDSVDNLDKNPEENFIESEEERQKWMRDYPVEGGERQEGQLFVSDFYDKEAIEIDKLAYLALHHRAIPIWVDRDVLKESRIKIAYLSQAHDLFLEKCKKEGITSFEDYDFEHKIHYRSKDWFQFFEELLAENEGEYRSTLKEVRDTISVFS